MDNWSDAWDLRPGTVYLNHGSFGPSPRVVRQAQRRWQDALESEPMDFFVRQLEPAWLKARQDLAEFLGARGEDLVFVENATMGMNVIAQGFPLTAGDEVLLTDHEYGAVFRTWEHACRQAGAEPPQTVSLPYPLQDEGQVVEAIFGAVTPRTRLLVVSHVTSPTAITLPVTELCREARRRNLPICIDGPHAPAYTNVHLESLECDFYTASCHKWLCAPFGTGFLFASPRWQQHLRPLVWSWGRLPPTERQVWWDEFLWSGTRDPSGYLTIPAAIDFLGETGWENFRHQTHELARYARQRLTDRYGTIPWVPDSPQWYGSMTHVPLPETVGSAPSLQQALWDRHRIEVPIIDFQDRRYIRVSCHLYNSREHVDYLCQALQDCGVG